MAIDKVNEAPAGDGFSVLLMKDNPVWIVGEVSHDSRKVIREIEQLHASHGNASVPATLNMVAGKVSEGSGRFPVQNVYFFTDMQKSTWLNVPPEESRPEGTRGGDRPAHLDIAQHARTIFVDLGRDDAKNVAVTDLRMEDAFITTGSTVTIKAMVQNYSAERTRAALRANFWWAGRRRGIRPAVWLSCRRFAVDKP